MVLDLECSFDLDIYAGGFFLNRDYCTNSSNRSIELLSYAQERKRRIIQAVYSIEFDIQYIL